MATLKVTFADTQPLEEQLAIPSLRHCDKRRKVKTKVALNLCTANVLTLQSRAAAPGLMAPRRMIAIQERMFNAGVHVAAIQEARTPQDRAFTTKSTTCSPPQPRPQANTAASCG